jgi:hypothetical protein
MTCTSKESMKLLEKSGAPGEIRTPVQDRAFRGNLRTTELVTTPLIVDEEIP